MAAGSCIRSCFVKANYSINENIVTDVKVRSSGWIDYNRLRSKLDQVVLVGAGSNIKDRFRPAKDHVVQVRAGTGIGSGRSWI